MQINLIYTCQNRIFLSKIKCGQFEIKNKSLTFQHFRFHLPSFLSLKLRCYKFS